MIKEERKVNRIEQEIGWLKVSFAILFATDISLIAWLVQNLEKASILIIWMAVIAATIVAFIVLAINIRVYNQLNELEEL